MTLLLSLLPLYLLGNLHCIGMCGPLAMMLAHHRYRYLYFLGRLCSFSLAGMLAGEAGAVLYQILRQYQIPALVCFLFGGIILAIGVCGLMGRSYPGEWWLSRRLQGVNKTLSLLLLRDLPIPTFLFGFFTVALPCGQTLVVFSACALYGSAGVGLLNGFVFALLTSPSLFLAMHAYSWLGAIKGYYNRFLGVCALFVGGLALCRGFAELGVISHYVLNPEAPEYFHIVIY